MFDVHLCDRGANARHALPGPREVPHISLEKIGRPTSIDCRAIEILCFRQSVTGHPDDVGICGEISGDLLKKNSVGLEFNCQFSWTRLFARSVDDALH